MNNKKIVFTCWFVIFVFLIGISITFADQLSLIYDANGNLVTGDGKYREYNGFNQLIRIREGNSVSGAILEEYLYHPIEERVLVRDIYNFTGQIAETVYYINDALVRVVNASGTYDNVYIRVDGQLVAQQENGVKTYIHSDHLGSVSTVTDQSGSVIEDTRYEPFGAIVSGGVKSRFDYTGQEFDSQVGDYDFKARRYDPDLAKFIQPDRNFPSVYDPQQLNRYSYAKNNPYNYVDPTGEAAIWIHYLDTYQSYRTAGFSPTEARRVAAGAIEPDLYRVAQQGGAQGLGAKMAAAYFNLDLQMEHTTDAEQFYHSYDPEEGGPLAGVTPGEHIDMLSEEFGEAVNAGDLDKMGNLEHALGGDVGTPTTPGYHSGSSTFNPLGLHKANDVLGIFVDKEALKREQAARAQAARTEIQKQSNAPREQRSWWQRMREKIGSKK